jgi:hypothetical protein
MKRSSLCVAIFALSSLAAPTALAVPRTELEVCGKDFAKAGCKPQTEEEAYQCLEKIEQEGKRHEGLHRRCYKAHEQYEKQTGREEGKGQQQE